MHKIGKESGLELYLMLLNFRAVPSATCREHFSPDGQVILGVDAKHWGSFTKKVNHKIYHDQG